MVISNSIFNSLFLPLLISWNNTYAVLLFVVCYCELCKGRFLYDSHCNFGDHCSYVPVTCMETSILDEVVY